MAVTSRFAPVTTRVVAAGSTTVMLDASMRTSVQTPVRVTSSVVEGMVTAPPRQSMATTSAWAGTAAPTRAADAMSEAAAAVARERTDGEGFMVAICPARTTRKPVTGKELVSGAGARLES